MAPLSSRFITSVRDRYPAPRKITSEGKRKDMMFNYSNYISGKVMSFGGIWSRTF